MNTIKKEMEVMRQIVTTYERRVLHSFTTCEARTGSVCVPGWLAPSDLSNFSFCCHDLVVNGAAVMLESFDCK